ncbi:hypothetical protein H7169_00460 [Candidatus Gracilibacteria bacterium]|nr:hypothetical protein [Candidatus Gracilibacteria bacterium]
MSTRILFRSLKSGQDRSGSSESTIRQRGYDWSHLRTYDNSDDIRDIAWGRTTPDGLSVRVRESHGDYPIISYWGSTVYDEFYYENPSESKRATIARAQLNISTSARSGQYQYREYTGDDGLENLVKTKPRNALIFISNTDITEDIRILAYHNDVIYLDLIHPWESDPTNDILFAGGILDIDSYTREYALAQQGKKNTLKRIRASYIPLITTADINNILNTFFKKRYSHG